MQLCRDEVLSPVGERALSWLAHWREFFDPFHGRSDPNEWHIKAFAELAMVCLYLRRQPSLAGDERLNSLLSVVFRVYRRQEFFDRRFRIRDQFLPHVLAAVALRDAGLLPNDPVEFELQDLARRGHIESVERVPHRVLELRRFLDTARVPHKLPGYDTLCRASILNRPINPIYLTTYDIYCVTHSLLYATDFGVLPVAGLSAARERKLREVVDVALGMEIYHQNWDLVGELILSCHCLRHTSGPFYAPGWQILREAQWADGAVPGPNFSIHETTEKAELERRDYIFEHCYHTTLVAAMVGALCPHPAQ
jgi:hypothetical protein